MQGRISASSLYITHYTRARLPLSHLHPVPHPDICCTPHRVCRSRYGAPPAVSATGGTTVPVVHIKSGAPTGDLCQACTTQDMTTCDRLATPPMLGAARRTPGVRLALSNIQEDGVAEAGRRRRVGAGVSPVTRPATAQASGRGETGEESGANGQTSTAVHNTARQMVREPEQR
jgi:hypothetical protein